MKCEYCGKDLGSIDHLTTTTSQKFLRFIPLSKLHYCDVNCYLLHALKIGVKEAEELMIYVVQNPNRVNKIFGDNAGKIDIDRFICPLGVKARFCKHQRSYSRGIPQYVEDVDFYCVIDSGKCDWKGEK